MGGRGRRSKVVAVAGAALLATSLLSFGGAVLVGSPASAAGGCADNGGYIPAGSKTASIGDVDGDGRADTEFVAVNGRTGIRTATGAVHTVANPLAGPGPHGTWVKKLSGGPVILVADDERQAELFSFVGCRLRPVKNLQGAQYSFWLNGNGPVPVRGTGVACGSTGDLQGVLARPVKGQREIDLTRIAVSSDGARATNANTHRGTTLHAAGSSAVRQANESRCSTVPTVRQDPE